MPHVARKSEQVDHIGRCGGGRRIGRGGGRRCDGGGRCGRGCGLLHSRCGERLLRLLGDGGDLLSGVLGDGGDPLPTYPPAGWRLAAYPLPTYPKFGIGTLPYPPKNPNPVLWSPRQPSALSRNSPSSYTPPQGPDVDSQTGETVKPLLPSPDFRPS